MHLLNDATNDDCSQEPTCQCKDGFVRDLETGECIKPYQCPCHHGHRSYKEGDQIRRDCNSWYFNDND